MNLLEFEQLMTGANMPRCLQRGALFDSNVYNAESALKLAQFVDPTDANTYFILGKRYYCTTDFAESAEAYENAVRVEPENCDFWAHLALAHARDDNRSESLSASEKVKVYERDASYQAIEIAALAHRVLMKIIDGQLEKKPEDENEKQKLTESCKSKMRASMLAKMDRYLRDDGKGEAIRLLYRIDYIKTKLNYTETKLNNINSEKKTPPKLGSCTLDVGWTFAQYAIALARLCEKLKENDSHLQEEEDRQASFLPPRFICDDKYVDGVLQKGIGYLEKEPDLKADSTCSCLGIDLERKSDPKNECRWAWLIELNKLALGCLYYCKSSRSDQKAENKQKALDLFREVKEDIKKELRKDDCGRHSPERPYILIKLGRIYLKTEKFEDAEDCFKSAIQMLEIDRPQMVMREKLRLQLAEAFRQQKKKFSALKEARKSQICNPINERLGEVTGDIYCDLEKYRVALEEFYGALVWEPDNPEILIKIGRCYLERAFVCREPADRKRSLEKANVHFEHAWELYETDNLKKRTEARYLMAKTYMELCDYDEALPHLKVIYNSMSSKKEITPKVLIVGINLGMTYLKMNYYNKCEEMFKEIIEMGLEYVKKNVIPELNKHRRYSIDEMSLAEIMASAHIGLARSFAERNTKICLDRALKEVQESEGYINLLKSGDEKTKCQAMSSDCEGWIRYKQYQICDKKISKTIKLECKELIELSIRRLESSVSIRAESRGYLHLALAYKAKSEIKTEPEPSNLLTRAKGCCKLARDLDIKGEYKKELKYLEKDLGIFKNDQAESAQSEPDR